MSVSDVIFMCINFVILMWIAWKLVGKKGFKSFKDRREHIAQEIQELILGLDFVGFDNFQNLVLP